MFNILVYVFIKYLWVVELVTQNLFEFLTYPLSHLLHIRPMSLNSHSKKCNEAGFYKLTTRVFQNHRPKKVRSHQRSRKLFQCFWKIENFPVADSDVFLLQTSLEITQKLFIQTLRKFHYN